MLGYDDVLFHRCQLLSRRFVVCSQGRCAKTSAPQREGASVSESQGGRLRCTDGDGDGDASSRGLVAMESPGSGGTGGGRGSSFWARLRCRGGVCAGDRAGIGRRRDEGICECASSQPGILRDACK